MTERTLIEPIPIEPLLHHDSESSALVALQPSGDGGTRLERIWLETADDVTYLVRRPLRPGGKKDDPAAWEAPIPSFEGFDLAAVMFVAPSKRVMVRGLRRRDSASTALEFVLAFPALARPDLARIGSWAASRIAHLEHELETKPPQTVGGIPREWTPGDTAVAKAVKRIWAEVAQIITERGGVAP